ncbi:MAG: rhamnan synthesis F family protein [Mailhella sp.]|nr:rhamnan synthesis F family protein [Mailhella sp.]
MNFHLSLTYIIRKKRIKCFTALNRIAMNTVEQLRKAVVFHLYYHELWEKIKPYLLNLQEIGSFDLYVTSPVENAELFDSIKQSFSDTVNIYILKNVGADLYPFFEVINSLDLEQYDILYKIHTKRNVNNGEKSTE